MAILVSPTASPVTCWQIGEAKKEKETPYTRLFPSLTFSCSYFKSLIAAVIALLWPQQSSADGKKNREGIW
jgi:hypothetical protein